jgi:glutathione S-transferase
VVCPQSQPWCVSSVLRCKIPSAHGNRIYTASKVPSLVYGGSPAAVEDPSPDSFKLAESLIIVDFVADLFPESGLLPKNPIDRARARFFIDVTNNKLISAWHTFLSKGGSPEKLFEGADAIQDLLSEEGPYALGKDFTIADVSIAPFLGRIHLLSKEDVGAYADGEGKKVYDVLQGDRYKKLKEYAEVLFARPSYTKTFPAVSALPRLLLCVTYPASQVYLVERAVQRFPKEARQTLVSSQA